MRWVFFVESHQNDIPGFFAYTYNKRQIIMSQNEIIQTLTHLSYVCQIYLLGKIKSITTKLILVEK